MRIPLPNMMRHWREREFEKHLSPATIRTGLGVWAFFAKRPRLYQWATRLAMRMLGNAGRGKGRFRFLPLAGGWTKYRDFPAPEGETFQEMWARRAGAPGKRAA
jgi:L-lactate dehydrogenase complex protein LldF